MTAREAQTLIVNGVTVAVTPETLIRHGHRRLRLDDVLVGDHVQVRGVMDEDVLVATEIKVQDTGRDNEPIEHGHRRRN